MPGSNVIIPNCHYGPGFPPQPPSHLLPLPRTHAAPSDPRAFMRSRPVRALTGELQHRHSREHKRREEEGSKTRAGFEESTQINIGNVGLSREAGLVSRRYSTWHMARIKRLKYLCLCGLPSMFSIFIRPCRVWVRGTSVETRRPITHMNRLMLKPTHVLHVCCITSSAFCLHIHIYVHKKNPRFL